MAVRYYLAPLIGTGTPLDPQRSVIRDWVLERKVRRCRTFAEISKVDGRPVRSWSFCEVGADDGDFSDLDADNRVALLGTEGARLGATPDAETDAALAKFGLARDQGDATVRAVIRRIGRTFQPGYVVSR